MSVGGVSGVGVSVGGSVGGSAARVAALRLKKAGYRKPCFLSISKSNKRGLGTSNHHRT